MKNFILLLIIAITFAQTCFASDNFIAYANKISTSKQAQNPTKEVKILLKKQLICTNTYNLEEMKKFYSKSYINSDGFDKKTYFELVEKTWNLYPDIKYNMEINNIQIIGNTAIAETSEFAKASSKEKVENSEITGYLNSTSNNVYYLEKVGEDWLITADHIINERTTLTYGEANDVKMELIVPQLIPANKDYTASLSITVPDKKMFVIASIGQEKITYPQISSDEVFRKLPENGILERIFKSNKNNFNEYTVASIGITRAKVAENKEIKLLVTGLGYIITRTNVIPEREAIKVKNNGKKETDKSME